MKTRIPIAVTSRINDMIVPRPPTSNFNYKSYFVNDCSNLVIRKKVIVLIEYLDFLGFVCNI